MIEKLFLNSRPIAIIISRHELRWFLLKHISIYLLCLRSIAPSIFGFEDVKKSISCLLFGGSRKRLPDGLNRRGDINVLVSLTEQRFYL